MNVNGIDPQLQAQANKLLQNKEKVDHGQEDLEVLWEYTKAANEIDLPADLSDEDVLAFFDKLDNQGNTAQTSVKLLLNAIKKGAVPKSDATPDVNTNSSVQSPTVNSPVVNSPVPDAPPVVTPSVDAQPPVIEDTVAPLSPEVTFVRIMPGRSQTLNINGQSYTIENLSKGANNVAYYVDGDNVVFEASDINVTSNQPGNVADNLKVTGNRNTINLGEGDDNVEVTGDSNMIYTGGGNDFVKMRGDYNSTDMDGTQNGTTLGNGNDTVWMAGNNNAAHGFDGDDNFFAIGANNTFYGMNGTDASYYNETEGVNNEFEIGKGHQFRVENTITDAKDFEDWAKRNEPEDGPPYTKLPEALDGHEVRAYDDNTYTDKYEEDPMYYTEYRDIAYRELDAKTSYNNVTGEGSVQKYNDDGSESQNVTINADGSAVVEQDNKTITISAKDLVYYDNENEVVTNPGNTQAILEKIATGKLYVGNADGVVVPDAPATPDVPVTPDVPDTPDVPQQPSTNPLPTANELKDLTNDLKAELADAKAAARDAYTSALSNTKPNGDFDTSDDIVAIQNYQNSMATINSKESVVVNKGLPLINSAVEEYSGAADVNTDYYTALREAVEKALEANKNYFDNLDAANEDELKAQAEEANSELEELMKN